MSALTNFRQQKDDFFEHHPQSPLTSGQKMDFSGLEYFDENASLDLKIRVEEFEEKEVFTMQTSTGDVQEYRKYGKVKFKVDGQDAELTVYASHHGFFLPFVDSQAPELTYGAGRYLDPEVLPDGRFHIDFNMAYNPYCVYNDNFSCPLTPWENRLKVPVKAGEKMPMGDWVEQG